MSERNKPTPPPREGPQDKLKVTCSVWFPMSTYNGQLAGPSRGLQLKTIRSLANSLSRQTQLGDTK